jgi:tetratricopeptide (TPR) repeat protein
LRNKKNNPICNGRWTEEVAKSNKTNFQNRRRSDQVRLDSWKAIANYVNRSERTVRRWEKDEGLPVHRHQHAKGVSVHAYSAEIDHWLNLQRQTGNEEEVPAAKKIKRFGPQVSAMRTLVLVFAVLIISAATLSILKVYEARNDAVPVEPRWALIAAPQVVGDVDDMGDLFLASLHRKINQTGRFQELPQEQVEKVLERMRLDPSTRLEPRIARELAQRESAVAVLLLPQIEYFGAGYNISVEIFEVETARVVAFPAAKVARRESIPSAMSRLVNDVDAQLHGLSLEGRKAVPRVSTHSFDALQHYSQAASLLSRGRASEANELLGVAIALDSEFVSAYALKAWAMRGKGSPSVEYRTLLETAVNLGTPVTAHEHLFISGSLSHFSGDFERARASYEALFELELDRGTAARALYELCKDAIGSGHCSEELVRLANHRPDDFSANVAAAWALASNYRQSHRAAPFSDTSLQLLQENGQNYQVEEVAMALVLPVLLAWLDDAPDTALVQSEALQREILVWPPAVRNRVVEHLVDVYLAIGRVSAARELIALSEDQPSKYKLEANIMFASGDMAGLKAHLQAHSYAGDPVIDLLRSISGLSLAESMSALAPGATTVTEQQSTVLEAIRAMQNERPDLAKIKFQAAATQSGSTIQAFDLVAADMLALLHKAEGNMTEALHILETTMRRKNRAILDGSGVFWMMCQRQLASLYRDAGRDNEAESIEAELLQHLATADEDFPLLRSLSGA